MCEWQHLLYNFFFHNFNGSVADATGAFILILFSEAPDLEDVQGWLLEENKTLAEVWSDLQFSKSQVRLRVETLGLF